MFERLALKALRQWAEKEDRKPLVIRGARQVGKTTLVKLFSQEFDIFMNLNLEEKENADLFTMNNSFEDLLTGIYAKTGFKKENKRTLIFIDEIQNVPDAVKSLRFFYEKRPDLHVIAAWIFAGEPSRQSYFFPRGTCRIHGFAALYFYRISQGSGSKYHSGTN